MSRLEIKGGKRIRGIIEMHGAKNAVLPILAATILTKGISVIHNCPKIKDVDVTIKILEVLGASVKREEHTLIVDTQQNLNCSIPEKLMIEIRSSIFFLGPILARCKRAKITSPGGCKLGPRPIDLHVSALRQLGVSILQTDDYLDCDAQNAANGEINLKFPSVGATENIILFSCLSHGVTTIKNAAKEPEIVDLVKFLNKMGAKISGEGTDTIVIEGVEELNGAEYSVMPDRIATITYLCCAAVTGGEIEIRKVNPKDVETCLECFIKCGCRIGIGKDRVFLRAPKRLKAIEFIETKPHPDFPTDAQSLFLAMMTTAEGKCLVRENIFESRFNIAEELNRMGADVTVVGQNALVRGRRQLKGTDVTAPDLRGGAGLCIAALAANGTTLIDKVCYIDRGYEEIETYLRKLGADITRFE